MISKKFLAFLLVIFIAILASSSFIIWKYWHSGQKNELVLHGNVDIRQVDLAFRVSGRILDVLVEEGQTVEKNQPLARLETDMLMQQLDQAKAEVAIQDANLKKLERGYRSQEIAQARAAVSSAQALADNRQINLARIMGLRKSNAVSQKELDNARATSKEAAASLKSAREHLEMLMAGYREEEVLAQKAALAAAQAKLEKARIQLDDGILYAPEKGVVLTRARETGAIVNEGQTVYTLTLSNPVWLRAYISEPELAKIKPGMPVQVAVDAFPDRKFPGFIGFISPTAEFTPKKVETREVRTSLVYRIRVRVEDKENIMRQGMPVTIFINLAANAHL